MRIIFPLIRFLHFTFLLVSSLLKKKKSKNKVEHHILYFYHLLAPQLISISCYRHKTEKLSNWSSANVENYRLISLEGLEIRFTVSNGQDLFDFWQNSPIVLGQERNGPFVDPPKLDAGFAREIKRHRHALRTGAKRAKKERKDIKLWT